MKYIVMYGLYSSGGNIQTEWAQGVYDDWAKAIGEAYLILVNSIESCYDYGSECGKHECVISNLYDLSDDAGAGFDLKVDDKLQEFASVYFLRDKEEE